MFACHSKESRLSEFIDRLSDSIVNSGSATPVAFDNLPFSICQPYVPTPRMEDGDFYCIPDYTRHTDLAKVLQSRHRLLWGLSLYEAVYQVTLRVQASLRLE